MLRAVQNVNRDVKVFVIEAVEARAKKDARIGILGLSFKPGSDDVRDAAALHVIRGLIAAGYTHIEAHDPLAIEAFRTAYPDVKVSYVADAQTLAKRADLLVLLTAWEEYRAMAAHRDKLLDFRYLL